MKKTAAILLSVLMLLSLCACGASQPAPDTPTPPGEEGFDPLILLTRVWDSYPDDEKFPVFGGNQDGDEIVMDGPGAYDIADTAGLDNLLGVPADAADKIGGAANLVHMLNTNTFTCGAFQVLRNEDAEPLAEAIRKNLENRHWICGCPDELVTISYGTTVVSFFGAKDLVETFHARLTETYPMADELLTTSYVTLNEPFSGDVPVEGPIVLPG